MAERNRPATTWKPGQSGNPAGKPKGARNRATQMVMKIMEAGAKDITEAVVRAAKDGDMEAARMIINRLAPPARERAVTLRALPDLSTAAGVSAALQQVTEALAVGELTPGEASTVAGILEARRKAIETEELERRIAALEGRTNETD